MCPYLKLNSKLSGVFTIFFKDGSRAFAASAQVNFVVVDMMSCTICLSYIIRLLVF